ncbi:methyl-accepting chemotaxis protein [Castellaniella sp.]|uniref:methyl-accepting chemotaxis protein n=1 Tax=Castellaniella sp. TaxID=1955812 RepID=UPI002B0018B5|nr:methyl-accepting chemotaxis protein [Castellaniella sp.]
MKNLKIGTRLALGFGFVILMLVIMTGIGLWRIMDSNTSSQMLQGREANNAAIMQWARQTEVNNNLTLAATNMNDPEAQAKARQGLEISDQRIAAFHKQLGDTIQNPQAIALFKQAIADQDIYFEKRNAAFKYLENWDVGKANAFFSHDMPDLSRTVTDTIDKLSAFQNQYTDQIFEQTLKANEIGMLILSIAALLALIISPLFAWRVTRSVTHPLRRAVRLAESVARRDLSQQVQAKGTDEVGQLLRALGAMTQQLHSTVGEVRSGANSIASAASQISAGNLDLSSRTEQQASSLAETAATMEQITATVRQNADNTQQANTLAAAAAKTATDGGTLVAQVVQTMGEINSKSQQVADIIGVIDSIAFQTNILALNAAVEAARAGEQGRGFAVVAAEVRALAQRSAGAAKEIKDLIDTSVAATTKGNEQAAHAGDTMQEIVDSINRVTDIMGEINAANREQTTGIEEINSAITQMDDVTRQNASLVEESAAAANSLQSQANTLAQLVSTFNLGAQDADHQGTAHANSRPAGASAGAQQHSGASAQHSAQAPRLPSAPEKVVSPAPQRPRRDTKAEHADAPSASRPALRAPGKPTPASADTEEWAEF